MQGGHLECALSFSPATSAWPLESSAATGAAGEEGCAGQFRLILFLDQRGVWESRVLRTDASYITTHRVRY